jgi:translation initiation factor IF-1
MVKNTKGGKGAKCLARKGQMQSTTCERVRLPTCELEQYAYVEKMFGNGMCEIFTNSDIRLIGHIRNKFRGRQKRNNIISVGSIVMIGLRDWENPAKNCDILCIFDEHQIEQLKTIPHINLTNVLHRRLTYSMSDARVADADNVLFTNDLEEEKLEAIAEVEEFNLDTQDEIDIDDI